MGLISAIYGRAKPEPKTPAEVKAECGKAWHEAGLIVIRPEWLGSWADRKQAELLAEKCHGKRRAK